MQGTCKAGHDAGGGGWDMNVKSKPPYLDIWSQLNILGCESVVLFVLTMYIFLQAVQEFDH